MRLKTILLFLVLSACNASSDVETVQLAPGDKTTADSLKTDSVSTPTTRVEELQPVPDCNCTEYRVKNYAGSDSSSLSFEKRFYRKVRETPAGVYVEEFFEHDSLLFLEYADPEKAAAIRQLNISGYNGELPKEFARFTGVENLFIHEGSISDFVALFPKLKSIQCFGGEIKMDAIAPHLEFINIGKGSIKGYHSFKQTPKIKEVHIGASFPDTLPVDVKNAPCLVSLNYAQNPHLHLDISKMDFSGHSCIREITLLTYNNGLSGMPVGLDNPNLKSIYLWKQGLSKEEKEFLRELRKTGKKITFPDWK